MATLTLKWGTLKRWNFSGSDACQKLFEEYENIGMTCCGMTQHDTLRQKEIICELIDLCDGDTIYLEWDGEYVSKADAKKYVMEYDEQ